MYCKEKLELPYSRRKRIMSANKTKKVKMATKSCPECDQQIPVACKSCPCGYVFISRKLLNAKLNERSSPAIAGWILLSRGSPRIISASNTGNASTSDKVCGDWIHFETHHPRPTNQPELPDQKPPNRPREEWEAKLIRLRPEATPLPSMLLAI
ncbi:UPF0547 protein C16orf87 homolog isoform X2 [Pseudoliparis swirei]|uniref:UPF0547 protein C16orf87 homolog isoform X2 n=1 Tax=Pseudoliparis swirei TaxID=2059687 RepID=UPI0024BD8C6A|nr:UPF0547 protein C16orf87 homolog isoform X2 [Pseudoliparis swirei]